MESLCTDLFLILTQKNEDRLYSNINTMDVLLHTDCFQIENL